MTSFNFMKEWLVITVVWLIIFAAGPLYMCYMHVAYGLEYDWTRILYSWVYTVMFLLLFLAHHFILVPRFLRKKKHIQYSVGVLLSVLIFIGYLLLYNPKYRPAPREMMADRPMIEEMMRHELPEPHGHPLAPPDMARIITLLLMFGVDLGAVAWFNEQKLRRDMLILERQNLAQELEHLRYQINPHFFMNTLNNIHALIDIDQEKAKRSIVEMSKLMRYALYENNAYMVELNREVEFLKQYISLMRLRYSDDKIEIQCDLPENVSKDVKMPPLLLATFVENAFKHGISYLSYSFINIHLWLENDGKVIRFQCNNSRHTLDSNTHDGSHGIGLENVRKRLDLQYKDNYILTITDSSNDIFGVDLSLFNN